MASFLGFDMAQEWADINIWEKFFQDYPIKTFVEIGTGHGGLTTYFALQCKQRGIEFHTFDNGHWFEAIDSTVPRMLGIEGKFHFVDVFTDPGKSEIESIIAKSPKPLAIFFDNGNKAREWAMYAGLTNRGDYLIVHDWETEFFASDIGAVPVEYILKDMADARPAGWKAQWFKRV